MRNSRFIPDERGTTIVEFGLTAPLFFMMLFGLIAASMLLWFQIALQHATETSARCATVNEAVCSGPEEIKSYAVQQTLGLPVPASVFAVASVACGNEVTATYAFPFVTSFFGEGITLSARSCFPK